MIDARTLQMRALYEKGHTLADIGVRFQLSRERVRQVLSRAGVKREDGGRAVQLEKRAAEKMAAKNEAAFARWGMSLDAHSAHIAMYGNSMVRGSPTNRYIEQRNHARFRGIPWEFTFGEWWDAWERSGLWAQRGTGRGYVMARFGDAGSYRVGNVKIITMPENTAESYLFRPAAVRRANGLEKKACSP